MNKEQKQALQIIKRNGELVQFDSQKIVRAIERAMMECDLVDSKLACDIANWIETSIKQREIKGDCTVEEVQDLVELKLMESLPAVAKKYILYREERTKVRNKKENNQSEYKMITDDFISNYKHIKPPMTPVGEFVYYRTYSRAIPKEHRREEWYETVRRAVEFNTSIIPTSKEEAEQLYDNIFNLRQFVSGRTFWIGNTEVSKKYALSNFNCAGCVCDNIRMFSDLFYLLLVGAGVGVRVLKDDVTQLPKFRTDIKVVHSYYKPVQKNIRQEYTGVSYFGDIVEITVGDSKEGWVQSLQWFLELMTSKQYRKINQIIFNYDNVRPFGETLKTFGGKASGHIALQEMLQSIDRIIKKDSTSKYKKLQPVDCLDIANLIGNGVIVGGVRRTAELVLGDNDDVDFVQAKSKLYTQNEDGSWIINKDIIHRQMSNNSLNYESKPTREQLHSQINTLRYSAEPNFVNAESAKKRRSDFKILNPCAEILLKENQCCNLTTVNAMAFVNEKGELNREELLKAQRLSARAGFRMTFLELELPHWDKAQKDDRLTGCSLTGWQDMINATKMNKEEEKKLLQSLRDIARSAVDEYSKEQNVNSSTLSTTWKPEGSLSLLPTVSSGLHYSHSPYYIRRVRINSSDPLLKACKELGYPIYPEVGQTLENAKTMVVEFPIKAPKGRTKYDVSAIEQLENYKFYMENYVEHNASITISVREHEWENVEQWLWDNWDSVVGVSFISLDDNFYELSPYEAITEQEYNERISKMKPLTNTIISKYETFEDFEILESDCEGGICPIR